MRAGLVDFGMTERPRWMPHLSITCAGVLAWAPATSPMTGSSRVLVCGEEHWHGAVPDHFMTHLAMWEDDDATWGDHVTDEEYAAAQRA
jgi:hypothetical protein